MLLLDLHEAARLAAVMARLHPEDRGGAGGRLLLPRHLVPLLFLGSLDIAFLLQPAAAWALLCQAGETI
jgi:hypothetical protein